MSDALFEFLAQVLIEGAAEFALSRDRAKANQDGPGENRDEAVHELSLQDRHDDPVYRKNLQRLIERNRQFEEGNE
jgi:hypothetical protein